MTSFFTALQQRNLVEDSTDPTALDAHLASGRRTVYVGFDPTAPSLHIGNLVPLLMLRRFQLAGHRPIALVGGATGLIGDPGGRDTEREFNSLETVEDWTNQLKTQVARFIDLDDTSGGRVVSNLDWTKNMDVITFLRDIGKNFSVNAMIKRDAVRNRLEREDYGISYTEFSYGLLQAMDFHHMYKTMDCTIQFGGSDQWGNIVGGIDLIRRKEANANAHCFTVPLLLKADGKKFGKSAGGAVWIDPAKTSIFRFYQFWLNSTDEDLSKLLSYFTLLPNDNLTQILQAHLQAPHLRHGQKTLAAEITRIVHGQAGLSSAESITEALFGQGDVRTLSATEAASLRQDGLENIDLDTSNINVLDLLVQAGSVKSKREAREFIAQGAIKVNSQPVTSEETTFSRSNALHGHYLIIQRGKKDFRMASWAA